MLIKINIMKNILFIIFSCLISITIPSYLTAQNQTSIYDLIPLEEYANIHVQKLYSDSLATAFVIWIKKNVKAHKHLFHTENIYVLEGAGMMTVADKQYTVKPGDFFFIPKNTIHKVEVSSVTPLKVLSIQSPEFLGDDRVFVE